MPKKCAISSRASTQAALIICAGGGQGACRGPADGVNQGLCQNPRHIPCSITAILKDSNTGFRGKKFRKASPPGSLIPKVACLSGCRTRFQKSNREGLDAQECQSICKAWMECGRPEGHNGGTKRWDSGTSSASSFQGSCYKEGSWWGGEEGDTWSGSSMLKKTTSSIERHPTDFQ